MRLRLGHPRRALVVAPHPDDEVIGAFGLIRTLRRLGTRVDVLIVTDGGASHPESRRWPRAKLTARRRRESRFALRALGLSAGHVKHLDLPDGGLPQVQVKLDGLMAREVYRRRGLDLIVGPAGDDDHADHRAVAAALARARTGAKRVEYPVWPAGSAAAFPLRLPVSGGGGAKRWAVRAYRSQLGGISDDPSGFALSYSQVAAFTRGVERFRAPR